MQKMHNLGTLGRVRRSNELGRGWQKLFGFLKNFNQSIYSLNNILEMNLSCDLIKF